MYFVLPSPNESFKDSIKFFYRIISESASFYSAEGDSVRSLMRTKTGQVRGDLVFWRAKLV